MINKLIFQGRLTADPELRTTTTGISVCESTIAWSERYGENETKCFLRCKFWRKTAEHFAHYFKKGSQVVLCGKLITEEWEQQGEKKSRTICEVSEVHFCEKKQDGATQYQEPSTSDGFEILDDDEELPF